MSDIVFSPWPQADPGPAPGSAELLYLRPALFVLLGRYWNPLTQTDTPLPPHRWVLVHSGEVFSEGTDSDAEGISTIFEPPLDALDEVKDDDTWELLLIPLFDGRADSNTYAEYGWAWIDVEAGVWVTGEDFHIAAKRPHTYANFVERPLLGIPVWSTRRKAQIGGGFDQSYPKARRFEDHGELETSELVPHGSRSAPWIMQVDHGWLRTYVQLRFYDHGRRAERPIPPGVLLASVDQDSFAAHGRSSVVLPDGSIYLVHALTPETADALMYYFELPSFARFRLEDDVLEAFDRDRDGSSVEFEKQAPGMLGTHYFLPQEWRSRGTEAWLGDRDACAELRRGFAELRTGGQDRAQPLCFHLDDVVTLLGTYYGKRIALFDHYLAIRDQASNEHGLVPWSKYEVPGFPLRAEDTMFVRGEGIEKMTRAIEYGGAFLEISHLRKCAFYDHDDGIGARAARPPAVSFASSPFTHCILDVRYLSYRVQGFDVKLAHLVSHVSCYVHAPSTDNRPDDPTGEHNLARTVGVPLVQHLLHTSSLIWDQSHPAHPGSADAKNYLAVPTSGLCDGAVVLKSRHVFGCRETQTGDMNSASEATIQVHPQPGRACVMTSTMHLYLTYAPHIDAYNKKTPNLPLALRPYAFEPGSRQVLDRVDRVAGYTHTVAHELGHEMGLPDEYIERVQPAPDLVGRLPPFFLNYETYPYTLAQTSMMCGNYFPRLRYVWSFLRPFCRSGAVSSWLAQAGPFYPQISTPDHGTFRYDLDYDSGPLWAPVLEGRVGHSSVRLFATCRDESLAGPMLTRPKTGVLDIPFDGILVVTTRFWFSFDSSVPTLEQRWKSMTNFGAPLQTRDGQPQVYIQTPGAAKFANVIILFQPRFEYGPIPYSKTWVQKSINRVTKKDDADVEVVVSAKAKQTPWVEAGTGAPRVHMRRSRPGRWLLRYAIDPSRWAMTFDNSQLGSKDLDVLGNWLAAKLQRGPGTFEEFQ